jgi:hypothetical protein
MWPVLFGFVAGALIYGMHPYLWKPFPQLFAGLFSARVADPVWLGIAGWLRVCFWMMAAIIGIVFVPASLQYADLGRYSEGFWASFHHTRAFGFLLGMAAGLACTSWYVDARTGTSQNLAARGAFVGVFALLVLLVALKGEVDLFGSLNKVQTSVITLEFDTSQRKGTTAPLTANAGQPSNAQSSESATLTVPSWTATDRIGPAMTILIDLSTLGVARDDQIAQFADGTTVPPLSIVPRDLQARAVTDFMARNEVSKLIKLRLELHEFKRDADPMYFDSEALEEARMAIQQRDLLFLDLRRADATNKREREQMVDALGWTYANFTVRSRMSLCLLRSAVPQEDGFDCASLKTEPLIWSMREELARTFIESIPPPEVVRDTPYLAIVAASIFYASGETEAAVALLDRWLRAARVGPRATGWLSRIYSIRVLNIMGLFLSNEANPIHLELGTKYQWAALRESDILIKAIPAMETYANARQIQRPKELDLLLLARAYAADKVVPCADSDVRQSGVRYFVYRRWSLLNNVVFYLARQPRLIERLELGEEFGALIEQLKLTRPDCLAADARGDIPQPFDPVTIPLQIEYATADALGRTLDTLARAHRTQANGRQTTRAVVQTAVCDANAAAIAAELLIRRSEWLTKRIGFGPKVSGKGFDHQSFVERPLATNGEEIVALQPRNDVEKLIADTKEAVEKLGEGACAMPRQP